MQGFVVGGQRTVTSGASKNRKQGGLERHAHATVMCDTRKVGAPSEP